MRSLLTLAFLAAGLLVSSAVYAADYTITLKDGAFTPANLTIPAGQKVEITVVNATDKTAEFESEDLDREKVVKAGDAIKVTVGPVKAGTYGYVNDYHDETKGTITAK